jgi:long-chain acyl-CoA synthetase
MKRPIMKNTFFYAKEKHWKSTFKRYLARKNNVILVDINKDLKQSIQKLAEVLRKGRKLIIFPEGTRSATGQMSSFKETFAILSKELNIPIVPVAIRGAHQAMPKGSLLPRFFKKVRVEFMHPVFPGNRSYEEIKNEVEEQVASALKD